LDYFKKNDHTVVPSSPVIPFDDPTILFTNAGMNQFKDVFTGRRKVDYKRATSAQKCIRAGGKHNDLDNVGFTARHHTFFEMLGNFSFGDYFKKEAIFYAWEYITRVLKLPADKLYATVYDTDDEAFDLWAKIAPELKNGRIMRFGKKDNYWSMGKIGPCGPCSEIHIDRGEKWGTGPDAVVNGESDRFVEIWNLVFMQYDQLPDGQVVPLPKPSVDTGAGLERITAVIQNVDTNYGIDLFRNLFAAISDILGSKYEDNVVAHNIIADHIRALTFAIADGAGISNEGQGYVLRRILRRAARHGAALGAEEPFIYRLVKPLVDEMGDAYPEIRQKQSHVEKVIKAEEESFGRTLETGLELFEKIVAKLDGKVINGEDVFRLYDTYGFPYDLVEILATEKNLTVDKDGFDRAMERQKELSRSGANFEAHSRTITNILEKDPPDIAPTEFIRDSLKAESRVKDAYRVENAGQFNVVLILDRTPFYAEAGGQISDMGRIYNDKIEVEVKTMYHHRDWFIHEGVQTRGSFEDFDKFEGMTVTAEVDAERRWQIMRNHTATHLTHAALRQVLGPHISQSGSYVGPDRLRFDFSHHQPMTPGEIEAVEQIVNDQILAGNAVATQVMDIDSARATGAMALFGEKYDEEVRVVSVGEFSKELCGGTHVTNVSQIGPFFITLETGVASGVRRLEAITGQAAIKYMFEARQFRRQVAGIIGRPEIDALAGVEQLKEQHDAAQKEIKKIKSEMFSGGGNAVGSEVMIGPVKFVSHDFGETDRDIMASWIDSQKQLPQATVAIALGQVNGKITYAASASGTAVKKHGIHVGNLSKELLPQFGGRGGGKPNFAQGSVATGTVPQELFDRAKVILETEAEK